MMRFNIFKFKYFILAIILLLEILHNYTVYSLAVCYIIRQDYIKSEYYFNKTIVNLIYIILKAVYKDKYICYIIAVAYR